MIYHHTKNIKKDSSRMKKSSMPIYQHLSNRTVHSSTENNTHGQRRMNNQQSSARIAKQRSVNNPNDRPQFLPTLSHRFWSPWAGAAGRLLWQERWSSLGAPNLIALGASAFKIHLFFCTAKDNDRFPLRSDMKRTDLTFVKRYDGRDRNK